MFKSKTFSCFFFAIFFLLIYNFIIFAEDITITTYYPSPEGVYDELRTNKLAVGSATGMPADGNVAIGGDLNVVGTISKGAGTFLIDHPLYPETKQLIHGFLEGPEHGVIYRGETNLSEGQAIVELPSYFDALVESTGSTIQLTPKDGWSPLYVEGIIRDNKFVVKTTIQGNSNQRFYWQVQAERKDKFAKEHPVVVERNKE